MLARSVARNLRPREEGPLEPDVENSWLVALAGQVPLLYAILCLAVLAAAITFANAARQDVVFGAPGVLILLAIGHAAQLRRRGRRAGLGAARTAANGVVATLGLIFSVWAMALYVHGDENERSQLIYAVIVINMISLSALPYSAKSTRLFGGLTLPVFLLVYGLTNAPSPPLVAGNFLVVGALLARMMMSSTKSLEALAEAQRRAFRLAEENRRLANTDFLTGLSNRREFFAILEKEITGSDAKGPLVMGLIDLDGFKPVNDLYGHAVGDRVLAECSARLATFARNSAVIARLGGDEFAILLRGEFDVEDILAFGARVCGALKAPIKVGDVQAAVSASIGFARYPADAGDSRQLYERADYTLYYCKQRHRGEAVMFSPDHESRMQITAQVEQAFRKADFESELSLEFQPLFSVGDGALVAFEALARWNSPELGPIAPNVFIPVAERSEIIHLLTRAMLRKALRAAHDWPESISLAINLSMRDLLSRSALTQVVAIIESSGFEPSRLDIEVTETELVSDFDRACDAIHALKRLGVKISLDDFGTGYSSLSYLHRLPLDKVKIDKSFVQEMGKNRIVRDIVKSMIELCGNLKLVCVIEGVETIGQYELLRSFGCDEVQGFLFSRPIAAGEVARFVDETCRARLTRQA